MHREQITDKQAICLLTIFTMGSTLILGTGGDAKNDSWLAGIVGMLMAIPIILVYSRVLSLFPGKDIFEILDIAFGKILGKAVSALYIWYAFHLGALVMRNFGEFINTVTMPETPMLVALVFLGAVCIFVVRSGVEVMGRVSAYLLPAVIFILVAVQLMAIPILNFDNIKPILGQGVGVVLKGGFAAFSFPFAETVVFMGVFFSLKKAKASYKVYLKGLLFAGFFIVILILRNILVLGELRVRANFPSHVAVSRISIGEFLQRIEVTVAFVFVVCAFIKSGVCMFVACKGISRIFGLKDYRTVVIQIGLLMIYFSYTVYDNIMEMRYWAFKVYPYYVFPFQVILPLIIWIVAEVKTKRSSIKTFKTG